MVSKRSSQFIWGILLAVFISAGICLPVSADMKDCTQIWIYGPAYAHQGDLVTYTFSSSSCLPAGESSVYYDDSSLELISSFGLGRCTAGYCHMSMGYLSGTMTVRVRPEVPRGTKIIIRQSTLFESGDNPDWESDSTSFATTVVGPHDKPIPEFPGLTVPAVFFAGLLALGVYFKQIA